MTTPQPAGGVAAATSPLPDRPTREQDLVVTELSKSFGDFTAVDRISLVVERGEFFSILGPSGCGKTTLLRMLAGFEEPTSGGIRIRDREMVGVPPNLRPVNLVFQHLALFPMMNVTENIAFGLKRRKFDRETIRRKTGEILERVGLPGYGEKQISQLSGGQKQRVAIARCLVLEPSVLLLDEPLGALDLKLREQMKVELKQLQARVGTTFIYITHDQSEALVMSDRIAVMNQGHFEQVGSPQQLYSQPATPFVAQFVGDNNSWAGEIVEQREAEVLIRTAEDLLFRCRHCAALPPGQKVKLFLRPEALIIEPPAEQPNRFGVTVRALLFDGANSRLLCETAGGHELLVALPQNRAFDHIAAGQQIEIGWHPEAGVYFAEET